MNKINHNRGINSREEKLEALQKSALKLLPILAFYYPRLSKRLLYKANYYSCNLKRVPILYAFNFYFYAKKNNTVKLRLWDVWARTCNKFDDFTSEVACFIAVLIGVDIQLMFVVNKVAFYCSSQVILLLVNVKIICVNKIID